jgi:N-hydroxyarylamine O-acetyltransferase
MDENAVEAYLQRIAARRPKVADAAALRALHQAHLLTVPFENLSIHLAEPISLDPGDLFAKIVTRRRGGFCYELNGAFALLLEALGMRVRRLPARVFGDGGELSPPFDHLALAVYPVDGSGPWLADVGFGSHSDYPLRLDSRRPQDDPAGRFEVTEAGLGDLDVLRDGEPQYRVESRERALTDFGPTCWWQATSPNSHFTQAPICSRRTAGGRVSISGRTLIQTSDGRRTEQPLGSGQAVLAAYREHFGLVLGRVPGPAGATPARPGAAGATPARPGTAGATPAG